MGKDIGTTTTSWEFKLSDKSPNYFKIKLAEELWKCDEAPCFWHGMTYKEMQEGVRTEESVLYDKILGTLNMRTDLIKALKNKKVHCLLVENEIFLNPADFLEWGIDRFLKDKNKGYWKFFRQLPTFLRNYCLVLLKKNK